MKKLTILTALSLALPLTLPASQLILERFAQTDAQVLASSVLPATRAGSTGYYPLNVAEDAVASSSRNYYVNYVKLTSPSDGEQTINVGSKSPQLIYRPMLDQTFRVKAGETVTPNINFSSAWMNGYVYVDYDQDGVFNWDLNDNYTAPEGCELVSYYYIETVENTSGFNYLGQPVSGNDRNTMETPAFQIPANLAPGFYRMRFKVDWGNADPGGRVTQTNGIVDNGGSIIDVRLNVHTDNVVVTLAETQHGQVLASDGSALSQSVKFGEPLALNLKAEEGYEPASVTVKHGYHLDGAEELNGTRQYDEITFPAYAIPADGLLTIPAEYVDGDLQITVNFREKSAETGEQDRYGLNFGKDLTISRNDRTLNTVSLTGDEGCNFTSSAMSTDPKTVYQDKTQDVALARQGETITPSLNYTTGGPMHGYFYMDLNQDGVFDVEIGADHKPTVNSELLSYSYLDGYNSNGEAHAYDEKPIVFPSFKIPEMLKDGVYRARLKIDWSSSDPKGRYTGTNDIDDNGGYIVDFLINVSSADKVLDVDVFNGNAYATDGGALPYNLNGVTTLNMKLQPVTTDYTLSGPVTVRTGVNFDGPQEICGNKQWTEYEAQPDENGNIQVPVMGGVSVKANYEAAEDAAYKLVFNDEFNAENGTRADESKWRCSQRQSSPWNRFISDSIDVAYQADGKLVLKAIPNKDKTVDNVDMLTGAVETRGLFTFKRGKLECRAKTNGYRGNFPAIWLMPQNQKDGWPDCGEIDIFEQVDAEGKSYHTVHSNWTYDLGHKSDPTSSFSKALNMDRYHTYGLEWDENIITWFVDGVKVGSYAKSTDQSKLDQGQWPFDKAFYIILNQSVGNGSWAANADINHTYRMDVDWVRVYQKSVSIDADDKYAPSVAGTYNATLNRGFVQGWNTICLPFATTPEAICPGANAQEFSSYTDAGLNFKKVEVMEAGKPYLIYCPTAVSAPVEFENVTFITGAPQEVTPAGSPFTFVGSYDPISMNGLYGVARIDGVDKLAEGDASSSLKTTGSFFELKTTSGVRGLNLNFDGTTTGIVDLQNGIQNPFNVYTVDGVLVRKQVTTTSGLKEGVYVIDNKKVYIKK